MGGGAARRTDIVGRESELDDVRAFLESGGHGPAALILEGEPGIGKTTLWEWTVRAAAGDRVLWCRGAEAEAALSFAGLVDLFAGVGTEAAPELPEPQRRALAVALLREPPDEGTSDRLALSLAVAALLRALAFERPTLLAVDDVHWLDASTSDVLAFAVRRLESAPLRVVVSGRPDGAGTLPLGLARSVPGLDVRTVRLGPLSAGAIGLLVHDALGEPLSRPTVMALHQASGGNPFFALEIARAIAAGRAGVGEDGSLPVPDALAALVGARLSSLSPAAAEAVLLVASSNAATGSLEAAVPPDGLREAIVAGILEVRDDRIAFTHPLLRSVALGRALPGERRAAHRRLAGLVEDPEERAVHHALSTRDADPAVAADLDEASRVAASRGALEVSAWMAEQAARLTPATDRRERWRRLLAAAEQHRASGDPGRARAILEGLAAEVPSGRDRAEVLWRLSSARQNDLRAAIALCEQSLAEAGDDPALRGRIFLEMATHAWLLGELAGSAEHCRTAVREAERSGDPVLLASGLAEVAHAETVLGRRLPREEIDRAVELEGTGQGFPTWFRPSFQLGILLTYTDQLEEARPLLAAQVDRFTAAGDEAGRAGALFRMVELEFREGNWPRALALAREARALALHASVEQELSVVLGALALVAAHLGEVEQAMDAAGQALELTERAGDAMGVLRNRGTLGFLALSVDDAAAAHAHLGPAAERLFDMGIGEFSITQVVHNELEALVALGDLDAADDMAAAIDRVGRQADRAWSLAAAARGRALVEASRGRLDLALEHAGEALRQHDRMPQAFDRGRTMLVRGTIERRAKRWGDARRSLDAALGIFDGLGARLWAEKARRELARVGGRRPEPLELTETERRVAELVASGRTTKEVADLLFLSPKTVAGNLTRVYRKLGVASRGQLAARLGRGNGHH